MAHNSGNATGPIAYGRSSETEQSENGFALRSTHESAGFLAATDGAERPRIVPGQLDQTGDRL